MGYLMELFYLKFRFWFQLSFLCMYSTSFAQLNTLSYGLSAGLFKELRVSMSLGYYGALANIGGGAESCVVRAKIPLFWYIQ